MSTNPDVTLYAMRDAIRTGNWLEAADQAQALDYHLSAGGTPPEAWREGPDAPTDHIGPVRYVDMDDDHTAVPDEDGDNCLTCGLAVPGPEATVHGVAR